MTFLVAATLAAAGLGCQPPGPGDEATVGSISSAANAPASLQTFYQECLEIDQVTDPPSLLSDDANLFAGNDPADGTPSFRKSPCSAGLSLPAYKDWDDLGNALGDHRLLDLNDGNGRDTTSFPQSNSCVGASQVLSKMDLTYIAAAQNGQLAYFAVQRADNSGDAGYYWLFTRQQPTTSVQGACKNGQYDLSYTITTGDVLLAGHYSSNGTPLLRVFKANRNENGVSAVSAVDFTNARWSEDSTRLKNVAVNTTRTAAGALGTTGLKTPLDGGKTMDTQLFAEAALDLATFGQQNGVACGDLFYATVITRSSGSGGTSPDLKDLAGPAKFNLQAVSASPSLTPSCGGFDYAANVVGPANSTCSWVFTDLNGNPIKDDKGVPITSNTCNGTVILSLADQLSPRSYIGTVTVKSPGGCASTGVASSPTVPPGGCFGLSLTKAVDKATARPGDTLTYTVQYTNSGGAALTNVALSDPLPARTRFASLSTNPPINCTAPAVGSGGTISCTIASLAAGAGGTLTLSVTLDSTFPVGTTRITNTATARADQAGPVSASAVTDVTAAPVLAITKAVDKAVASPGELLTYTLSYTNSGNADATSVVISDALPARTSFVSASAGGAFAAGTVSWSIGDLAAGASGTVSFVVQLDAVFPAGTTQIVNSGVIQSAEVPTTTSNPVVTLVSAAPALSITKSAVTTRAPLDITNTATLTSNETAGAPQSASAAVNDSRLAQIVYTITIANAGNAAATGVVVSDPLPAGTTFVSASGGGSFANGTVTWTLPSLGALGGNATYTLVVNVN